MTIGIDDVKVGMLITVIEGPPICGGRDGSWNGGVFRTLSINRPFVATEQLASNCGILIGKKWSFDLREMIIGRASPEYLEVLQGKGKGEIMNPKLVVLEPKSTEVSLNNLSEERIYGFKHEHRGAVHILKQIHSAGKKWHWLSIDDTGGHCGSFESMREAIEDRIVGYQYEVFEFAGQIEFLNWAKKQAEK